MPCDVTFNGAAVPQKEVECSGEAARDMANNNATDRVQSVVQPGVQ